jgi:hypothetical protein
LAALAFLNVFMLVPLVCLIIAPLVLLGLLEVDKRVNQRSNSNGLQEDHDSSLTDNVSPFVSQSVEPVLNPPHHTVSIFNKSSVYLGQAPVEEEKSTLQQGAY